MRTKQIIITVSILVVVAAIACFVYLPSSYSHTLNAVKLDADGNEIGTVQITMRGIKWSSLLLPDRLTVTVDPFDGLKKLDLDSAEFRSTRWYDYLETSFVHVHSDMDTSLDGKEMLDSFTSETFQFSIKLSPDFDRWSICRILDKTERVYYLTSISGNYSTQELLDYFSDLPPGYEPS